MVTGEAANNGCNHEQYRNFCVGETLGPYNYVHVPVNVFLCRYARSIFLYIQCFICRLRDCTQLFLLLPNFSTWLLLAVAHVGFLGSKYLRLYWPTR